MFARSLIVLLLVLNLGVAAWWGLRPAPAAPPSPAPPADVPRLRLLGEAGPASGATPPPAAAVAPTAPDARQEDARPGTDVERAGAAGGAAAAPAQRCFAFGPFAAAAAADAARAVLQPRSLRLRVRSEPVRVRGNRWDVLLPPQADRAAAQALAQRVDAAGFKDYYVIGEGDSANAIALGRFGSEQAARRHQAALQAAGFPAQVQGPPAAASRIWLDVAAGDAFDADAARRAVSAPRVLPATCEALG